MKTLLLKTDVVPVVTRASILTLDPSRGGVPALARTVYRLLASGGHEPVMIYRAQEEVPTASRWAVLKHFLTTPPMRYLRQQSFDCLAVTDYPVPPRYQYHLLRLASSVLKSPISAVVSGSSHVGLPLALARRPYVLWVATLYEDELRGRAEAGDKWAADFLRHADWPALEAQERLVYERTSLILGLSPHTSERIAARWPALKPKLRTVINPIATDVFKPGHIQTNPPYIFLSARIRDPRKNVNLLVRAFARVRAHFPQFQLVIAGDEPLPETVTLANELGLSESVRGLCFRERTDCRLQGASLYAFPSLQEGLGISILEAMACGLPVIISENVGAAIRNGEDGFVVPIRSPEAIAEKLVYLYNHNSERRKMGRSAFEYVSRFTWERYQAELVAHYRDIWR